MLPGFVCSVRMRIRPDPDLDPAQHCPGHPETSYYYSFQGGSGPLEKCQVGFRTSWPPRDLLMPILGGAAPWRRIKEGFYISGQPEII